MHSHISSIIVDLKIRSTPTNKTQPCSSLLVRANYILLCNVSTLYVKGIKTCLLVSFASAMPL